MGSGSTAARRRPGTMPTATCRRRSRRSTRAEHTIAITEFADRIVARRSSLRRRLQPSPRRKPDVAPAHRRPEASPSLVALNESSNTVRPGRVVDHDYVVASDRFGASYPWPSAHTLAASGGFDAHFDHMRTFWNQQLRAIAQVTLPNPSWSMPTRADSSRRRSPAAATTSIPESTGTRASTATT